MLCIVDGYRRDQSTVSLELPQQIAEGRYLPHLQAPEGLAALARREVVPGQAIQELTLAVRIL